MNQIEQRTREPDDLDPARSILTILCAALAVWGFVGSLVLLVMVLCGRSPW